MAKQLIKLTPQTRDAMLKDLHDAFCHDGLLGKMDKLVDSFKEYKKGAERKE